jgi:uncharacterized protein (TIGR03083 family)
VNIITTFGQSAEAFLGMVEQIEPQQWELPGLGNWNVRSLAGHTARAILTVENYLLQEEPSDITIPAAEDYYGSVFSQFTDAAAVEKRGVLAGEWLASDPVGQVSAAIGRAKALIDAQPPNRIVSIGGMGILISEYLRTRVFELVVHSIDLSRATGIRADLPESGVASATALAAGITVARGRGQDLLLALTGRASFPADFSVV